MDDSFNILQNRLLYIDTLSAAELANATLSFHAGNGSRPLPMLSFALDYWRAGAMDATTFKTTNLVIHGLTTFFLAFFFRRLLLLAGCAPQRAAWGALALAFVWAVHALQVSSVMYIVQRMQTMSTLFVVLALWAYLAMRQVQINDTGRGRGMGVLVLVFGALALACKEDAVLLFAYVLALELTVLQFRAAQLNITKGLRQSFGVLTLLALLVYVFVVVPHYWHWDAYPNRDFSSLERLMTQARVLIMYLGQIIFPWPDSMTFIYDKVSVSRSLWQPLTTLPSIFLIVALLAWAWRWRAYRPLFSAGVLLFFSGHFIASNILSLELVFEHRNHFPLIGAVLALGDLLVFAWQRWHVGVRGVVACGGLVVIILGAATLVRAYTWGDSVRHGEQLIRLLPDSARAWKELGRAHFDRYQTTQDDSHLQRAIDVYAAGLLQVEEPSLASNLVIYKSLLGTVEDADWQKFLDVLRNAPHGWQNKFVVWTLMNNVNRGFDVDAQRVIKAINIMVDKASLSDLEFLRLAVFVYKNGRPEEANPFFIAFAESAPKGDANLHRIIGELLNEGHKELAAQLERIDASKEAVK
ncbi:hypothetical protein [Gilvimarinus polysaccharolyticus]|uniref:hypothetical protein n=1 Tax=Gilvimarinus polysaccharolyticus TaxID=863921 RepID=UPI0018DCEC2B|nr:hypothetical protein [Gilvimarinus polysaccharolyticus]